MINTRPLVRRCAPVLLALALAAPARAQNDTSDTPASHDAGIERVLQLKGDDFDKSLQKLYIGYTKASPTLPALRRLLDRLEAERTARKAAASPANSRGESADPFRELQLPHSNVVRLIADIGEDQDYKRLLQIYDSLPADYWMQGVFFDALSHMWFRRELPGLIKSTPKVSPPPSQEPLPANLQGAAPPLVEAWRLYKGVVAPFNARFAPSARQPDAPVIEAQQSWPAFYKVISDFFHGRGEDTVEKIAAFEWGGWCGTGSELLYGPRNRTLFMALCRQKRFDLALGALMAGADRERFRFGAKKAEWPQSFIAACGLDWQVLYAGAVLDGGDRTPELAAQGGEESARLLELMSALPFITEREDYLKAVAAFVVPAPFASGGMPEMVAGLRLVSSPQVAPERQQRLLEILHAQMKPDVGLRTVDAASHLLRDLRRPESAEVLKLALKSPYSRVRDNAFRALAEMGHKVEAPPVLSRANFRVLLNGQPLGGTSLNWEMQSKVPGGISSISSSAQTNGEGVLQLERDYLEDTKRKAASLQFTTPTLKSPSDAWIEASIPIPADLNARTDITIATQSLTLKVAPVAGGAKTMTVRLKSERHKSHGVYFEAISEWIEVPADAPVTFPRLQRGRYHLEVLAPGAARWKSPDVTLGAQPETVQAALQKGADVRFELLAPGGESRDLSPDHALMSTDGPPDRYKFYDYLDYATRTYRGLPLGNYKVQVKPSRERPQNRRATVVTTAPYHGEERAFVIDAKSPPLIELGMIVLKPAPAHEAAPSSEEAAGLAVQF